MAGSLYRKGNIALFLADFDHQVSLIEKIYDRLDTKSNALARKKVTQEFVERRDSQ